MKQRFAVKAAPPPGDSAAEFVMSDNSVDRMGDVIEPAGWDLGNFSPDKNPVALLNHKADQIIGNWRDVRVVRNRLLGRLELAAKGTSALVDTVRALVEQNILRAVSVGFRPTKMEPLDDSADEFWGPFRFLEQELLECSLVAVPANPNALTTAKALNLSPDIIAEVFGKPAQQDRPIIVRALTRKPAQSLVPIGAKMLTRAQRIEAAQQSLVAMRDRLDALDGLEERNETEQAEYVGLPRQIDDTEQSLVAMEAAERALVGKTGKTLPTSNAIRVPAAPRKYLEHRREYIYKAAATLFLAKTLNRPIDEILRERYGGDDGIGMVIKAAVAPAQTTVATWAAELVNTAVADFLGALPRTAIYPVLRSIGPGFTFGQNGVIRVPARSATPKVNGSFVGEGQPIPVRKMGLTAITLTPKKMGVISEFTREMAQHSMPSIESVIRQAINDDTAEAIDQALIDNVAADTIRPAGLLNGLSTLTPAATGTQFEKMVADINTLMAPIAAARGGQRLVMLMNPAQANKMSWAVAPNGTFVFSTLENGTVRNLSIVVSTTVPAARVIMLDATEFASATGDTPEFDVSDVATLHEEDTTPLPISATGAPNTVAAPVRSLFQTASIAIRMLLAMNWAMRRTGMVTFMDAVTW